MSAPARPGVLKGILLRGSPHFSPGSVAAIVLAAALLAFSASPAPADIYRWVDDQGTIHFTDDRTNIPERYRDDPGVVVLETPAPLPDDSAPPGAGAPAADEDPRPDEDLESMAEQLRAKIAAKEQHVKSVEDKQSLAVNPLRNRIVDPADLDLYRKYQAELPADRERLREIESLIQGTR